MSGEAAPPVSPRRWIAFAVTGAVVALAACGVLVALTFDASTWQALRRVGPHIAVFLAALMIANWLASASRLWLLTRSVGYRLRFRDTLLAAICGEFGVASTPTGLGGTALRLAVLRSRGVPLSEGSAVVGADLLLDGGVAVLVTVLALPLAFMYPGSRPMVEKLSREMEPRLLIIAGGLAALITVLALLWRAAARRRRRPAPGAEERAALEQASVAGLGADADASEGTDGGGPKGLFARLKRTASEGIYRARLGLQTLFRYHPRTVAASFVLAFVQLFCRYSILPVVVTALAGGPVNAFALYPLQGLLLMVAHAVVLPGGGGSVELGAAAALALFLPAHLVGAAVLLWRLFTFHWNLFLGGAVFSFTLAREGRRWAR
jgi:hypothetical protein